MSYLPDYEGHLPHLLSHSKPENIEESIAGYYSFLKTDATKSGWPLGNISSFYSACAMAKWIQTGNITDVKHCSYLSAKLRRISYVYSPANSLAYGIFRMFEALLSDEPNVIHWFAWHILPCLAKSKGRQPSYLQPGSQEFHAFNCHLALLGEFDCLAERVDQALADGVKLRDGKSYRFDNLFLKALVEGDTQGMEDNIHALLTGRVAYARNNENGMAYQSKVVSTWGVILSKIAYRNGFELDIDSPWVPKEWLPIQPLDDYPEDIDFMAEFDMFRPFKKGSVYFKNAMDFSPIHPSQEQPNFREWVERVDWEYP